MFFLASDRTRGKISPRIHMTDSSSLNDMGSPNKNVILNNRQRDLEFYIEEISLENELIAKEILNQQQAKVKMNDDNSYKIQLIKDSEAELAGLKAESQEKEEELSRLYSELEKKNEEHELIIHRINSYSPGTLESIQSMGEAVSYKSAEYESNLSQIRILMNELDSAKAKLESIGDLPMLDDDIEISDNWKLEKEELNETIQDEYDATSLLINELDFLSSSFDFTGGFDEEKVEMYKKVLLAEIEFGLKSEQNNIQASLESELLIQKQLDAELREVTKSSNELKTFKEEFITRQMQHCNIAASSAWLNRLQEELGKLNGSTS